MKQSDLRADYATLYRSLRAERRMRSHVFPPGHAKHEEKLAEIDRMLAIIDTWKDLLKEHCDPEYEQELLLDVPVPVKYA